MNVTVSAQDEREVEVLAVCHFSTGPNPLWDVTLRCDLADLFGETSARSGKLDCVRGSSD